MDYSEIKVEILSITNNLNSIVSTSIYDYTHQPETKEIVYGIDTCIEELQKLKNNLLNKI